MRPKPTPWETLWWQERNRRYASSGKSRGEIVCLSDSAFCTSLHVIGGQMRRRRMVQEDEERCRVVGLMVGRMKSRVEFSRLFIRLAW